MNEANELMTQQGYDNLVEEIKDLRNNQRIKIVEEIEIARSHGDLKENAEYHAAKEKQSFIDTRIAEVSSVIAKAKIIDPATLEHTRVSFGSTVELLNLDTDKKVTYKIAGMNESNPDENIIYYNSPLAKQLLNKECGEEVEITLPSGINEFEILNIKYP